MTQKLLSLYGLKFNPFTPDLPTDAIYVPPRSTTSAGASSRCKCAKTAGDARLPDKLRREDLVPLGSRIRARLATEYASREELPACLNRLLAGAGNASLMTPGLRQTLCDHAAGNYRILMTLAGELLTVAARRDLGVLDEKLYLDVFAQPDTQPQRRAAVR